MEITKESEKIICCIYKIYLERRKKGVSKSEAVKFEDNFYKYDKHLLKFSECDVDDCLQELNENKYIRMNIIGEITLENSTIVYMENRFKNNFKTLVDFIVDLV